MTDNATGADNQQERPQPIPGELGHYLSGFADGEGSFNVSVISRSADYRNQWKIVARFNVSQRDSQIPKLFQQVLKCGSIRCRRDGVCYFEVSSIKELNVNVRNFFESFPLVSNRQEKRLRLLMKVVAIMAAKKHLESEGLEEVLRIRELMVCARKRKYEIADVLRNPQRPYAGLTRVR